MQETWIEEPWGAHFRWQVSLQVSQGIARVHIESYPGGNPVANLKSISHRFYLRDVVCEWELTKESICLPLGCLQGGVPSLGVTEMMRGATEGGSTYESWNPCLIALTCRGFSLHQPRSSKFGKTRPDDCRVLRQKKIKNLRRWELKRVPVHLSTTRHEKQNCQQPSFAVLSTFINCCQPRPNA